ncbi:MAG: acyl-CoA reductase [Myxococcota bacterium]
MSALDERIDRLDRALALWREPGSPWLARLAQQHGGFSPEVISLGVSAGIEHWTHDVLAALVRRELQEPCWTPRSMAVWLAGSVPTASFAALLLPLLTGSTVRAKPASADPVSPELFAGSLAEVGLAGALQLTTQAEALRGADCVVAYGRDSTIESVRARLSAGTVFVGYGHKLSLAAIGPEAGLEQAAPALARDLAIWDGRGCLSPAYTLVLDEPRGRARSFASELARALEDCEHELPRAKLDPAEEAGIREQRAVAALRAEGHLWMSENSTAWTVAYDPTGPLPSPGALRFARVVAVASRAELAERCRELSPHLSCVGESGWREGGAEIAEIAASAGASRVCALGRMQLPPIDWNHDGLSPLRPMLRLTDVERDEGRARKTGE